MLAALLVNLPKPAGKVYSDNPWREPRPKDKPKPKPDEIVLLTPH